MGLAGAGRALDEGLGVGVDALQDAQLRVVDRQRQERFVVDRDERARRRFPGGVHGRNGVRIDERSHSGWDLSVLLDLRDDPPEDLDQPLL